MLGDQAELAPALPQPTAQGKVTCTCTDRSRNGTRGAKGFQEATAKGREVPEPAGHRGARSPGLLAPERSPSLSCAARPLPSACQSLPAWPPGPPRPVAAAASGPPAAVPRNGQGGGLPEPELAQGRGRQPLQVTRTTRNERLRPASARVMPTTRCRCVQGPGKARGWRGNCEVSRCDVPFPESPIAQPSSNPSRGTARPPPEAIPSTPSGSPARTLHDMPPLS